MRSNQELFVYNIHSNFQFSKINSALSPLFKRVFAVDPRLLLPPTVFGTKNIRGDLGTGKDADLVQEWTKNA